MIRRFRAFRTETQAKPARRPFFIALLVFAGVSATAAWIRGERQRAISSLNSRLTLRVESTDGLLWPTRLKNVQFEVAPNLSVGVARVELGFLPWQRVKRAHGVVIRAHAPLDTFWEEARRFVVPADFEVTDARIEYTDASGGKLTANDVSFAPAAQNDHLHVRSLHAFGTTFRDVHLWASRPNTVLELRLTREVEDAKALQLDVTCTPGQGVEWALDIPSQPLSEFANRIGLKVGETWSEAVFVGTGSLIVPESRARSAQADFRFTVDNWHRPSWPEAQLLTGRSGAVALRISPGPNTTHPITRVEVAAGLFSLVGNGQLTFGEPNRLTFDAQGELSCARLLAHLPASPYRNRVHAHLREHPEDLTNATSVRLQLAVRAEAPRGRPLEFRWHLHAGCGLPEMNED